MVPIRIGWPRRATATMAKTNQSPSASGGKSERDVLQRIAEEIERQDYALLTADDLKTLRLRHPSEEQLVRGTSKDVEFRDARIEGQASGRPVWYGLYRLNHGDELFTLVKTDFGVEGGVKHIAKGVGALDVTGRGVKTDDLQDRVGDLLSTADIDAVDEWITIYEEDLTDYALADEVAAGVDTRTISMVEADPTCSWGELRDELEATLTDQEWSVVAEAIHSTQNAAVNNHCIEMSSVDYQVKYSLDHTVLYED